MTSTRKSRMVNKRISKANQESPDKDGSNTNKSKIRKRKLSDMLGSQWSKEELERFYEAYRKFGKDWKKVAGTIRNRSADMVDALYNVNRAYLSLPEGTATAAGLIAMMTDHYNILERSESDKDSNDGLQISQKPQKRGRGKFRPNMSKESDASYPDLLQYQSVTSTYGCLSLLKKKRSGGSRPRAVGKRTPRFPISYTYDKQDNKIVSPNKHGLKSEGNAADDEGVHVAALALAEASQRGGSPQVSRTPVRRAKHIKSSPVQGSERKHAESPVACPKLIGILMDDDGLEGSLGSREAENGDFVRDSGYMLDNESAGAVEVQQKVRKSQGKRQKGVELNQLDDVREACSGTEEGLPVGSTKNEIDTEFSNKKVARPSHDTRKRNRQLFSGDENTALDALQTLADLSFNILLPGSAVESESSVQPKEEKQNAVVVEKPRAPKTMSTNNKKAKRKLSSKKDKGQGHPSITEMEVSTEKSSKIQKGLSPDAKESSEAKQLKMQRRKQKPKEPKLQVPKAEVCEENCSIETQKAEVVVEEGKKPISKVKRGSHIIPIQKQGKLTRALEQVSSSLDQGKTVMDLADSAPQVSTTKQGSLPTKSRSRRKMDLQKVLARKELKSSENAGDARTERCSVSVNGSTTDLKEKLSHCLSSPMLRRWCMFEWFYSAIDYPWFAKSEFVEYLNHVGLGHVPRLTRVEWGVIRSSLGKPRRLSKQFLQEEREKLEQYRESVRAHYAELRAGIREGLPTDLARPLSVGQRVVACHPKTREIHDGSVLTIDRNRCRIQFDRPELGVEFVMDIDCMPLNPAENIPDSLRRRNVLVDKFCESFYETKLYAQPMEWKLGESMKFASNENLETADGSCHVSSSLYPMNTLMKQAKGDTIDAIVEAKAAVNEVAVAAQQAMYNQPCTLAQIQARETDIRALAELTRALDKKEALLIELRNMNEEVSTKQKEGDSIREFEHFRKQYAMVLFQLRDANDQVASALYYLRQRNTYHGNSTPPWLRPVDSSGGPLGTLKCSTFLNQESGTHVLSIVVASRQKARAMVDVAVKAFSSLKEGEDAFVRIGEALDSTKTWQTGADSGSSAVNSVPISDQGYCNPAIHDQIISCKLEPATVHALTWRSKISSNGNDSQSPSELISSCVATLLMIQTCTERHDPPAEVAQILDSAFTYLQPCCSQNLPIYREIEHCMGIIKNQMLAKIPTPSTAELTIV